jgi:hypothetical protein
LGLDVVAFVAQVRDLGFTPHIAPNTTRQRSTIDGRTTRHAGHGVSQRIRKRIEEPFGWMKTVAGGRKLRYIGTQTQPTVVPLQWRCLQHHPHRRTRRGGHLSADRHGIVQKVGAWSTFCTRVGHVAAERDGDPHPSTHLPRTLAARPR